jgi:hypothetical protein
MRAVLPLLCLLACLSSCSFVKKTFSSHRSDRDSAGHIDYDSLARLRTRDASRTSEASAVVKETTKIEKEGVVITLDPSRPDTARVDLTITWSGTDPKDFEPFDPNKKPEGVKIKGLPKNTTSISVPRERTDRTRDSSGTTKLQESDRLKDLEVKTSSTKDTRVVSSDKTVNRGRTSWRPPLALTILVIAGLVIGILIWYRRRSQKVTVEVEQDAERPKT